MKPMATVAALAWLAGGVQAQVLFESFDNPLGNWVNGWLYQNATIDNYYVATGNCDPNYRGNNGCGLWHVDTRGCGTGASGDLSIIRFNPGFAAQITEISFEVLAFTRQDISILDKDGVVIASLQGVENGRFPTCGGLFVHALSSNGVGAIRFDSSPYNGSDIEGNTATDNYSVVLQVPCYADCDSSTGVGILDIFDFRCFQNRFAASSAYACDCDTATGTGVCDIFDFLCFQNAFAAGCP